MCINHFSFELYFAIYLRYRIRRTLNFFRKDDPRARWSFCITQTHWHAYVWYAKMAQSYEIFSV